MSTVQSISHRLRSALQAHAAAGHTALIGPFGEVSYAQLARDIDAAAAAAHDHGLQRGELVGLVTRKTPEAIAAFFGLMQAGGCPGFMEPGLALDAAAERMLAVGMLRLVVEDAEAGAQLQALVPGLQVIALEALSGDGSWIDDGLSPDDRAQILFTSGSTGKSKGVLQPHRGLDSNASGVIAHTQITPDDRLLHAMPVHHTNGVNNQLIAPFLCGAQVVLIERFRAEDCVQQLRDYAPTYLTGVPTMYARMLPFLKEGERFPSLRFLRCGSAPITPALQVQIEEAFGVQLLVSYGLSEATCTSTMNPPGARRIGSIGTVLEGQVVKLFKPGTDEVVDRGEGEIRIGGEALMLGYIGTDAAQPIERGWLLTGDLGRFDEDGYLSITGRIKDVIIRGGENISPALIEAELSRHASVAECCVVGLPHHDLGEVPVAFVVLDPSAPAVDADALQGLIRQKLARTYVPQEIHFLKTLPVNGVGKVDRRALQRRFEVAPKAA
ncbi:Acyl-CoA synthetase (AMP-forming)/AMP-acid ligase II [Pseudoxanthomonas sp. GM95]|uniref:class I adenylate-forming enzyme family protein n=1 Tax=Pseudoxanthomonas sp. GM95 TaxID=1881043 RepID=UPI0008CFC3EA|nr:class I adenylate-forming enzyme family protein [Pseudoxanthomonas sp. GM95]SEK52124.1 Acyl-CoA synthetase (AMP-forming)/AMP-acid ligase II [Pseudoxanthomonas sp. GM95]